MIAIKSGGLCCGCGGAGGACPIHLNASPLQWEIRRQTHHESVGPDPTTDLGPDLSGVGEWLQYGEAAAPASGTLWTGSQEFAALPASYFAATFTALSDSYLTTRRFVPPWDTRTYRMTSLAVAGNDVTMGYSIDNFHAYNISTSGVLQAASWNAFFTLAAGAYAFGFTGMSQADQSGNPTYDFWDAYAVKPTDAINGVGGTPFDIGADKRGAGGEVKIALGIPGAEFIMRPNYETQQLELVAVSKIYDATFNIIPGATITHNFPIALPSDTVNANLAATLIFETKDALGNVIASRTESLTVRRTAFGAITRAPAAGSVTRTLSDASPTTPANQLCVIENDRPAAGQVTNFIPASHHFGVNGSGLQTLSPTTANAPHPWASDLSVRLLYAGSDRTTLKPTVTFSPALFAAATPFPNLVISGGFSATQAAPGSAVHAVAYTARPRNAEMVSGGVNKGTGWSGTPNINGNATWQLSAVSAAPLDLTAKYPGYDSVIMPAGTAFNIGAYCQGGLKAAWRGGSDTLFTVARNGAETPQPITLDTVVGGVPGTITENLVFATNSDELISPFPGSPTRLVRAYRDNTPGVPWFTSDEFNATFSALSKNTPANKAATAQIECRLTARSEIVDDFGLRMYIDSVARYLILGGTIGGTPATPWKTSLSGFAAVQPLKHRTGQSSAALTLFLAPLSAGTNGALFDGVNWWTPDAAISTTLQFDTDPSKLYGQLRLAARGCLNGQTENGRTSLLAVDPGFEIRWEGNSESVQLVSIYDATDSPATVFIERVSLFDNLGSLNPITTSLSDDWTAAGIVSAPFASASRYIPSGQGFPTPPALPGGSITIESPAIPAPP